MPRITRIEVQKRRPRRRSVYLDGQFAFGVHENVVAKYRLTVETDLTPEAVLAIEAGEVRQGCFDRAIGLVSRRPHGRAELRGKLVRKDFPDRVVDAVLDQLADYGYLDDAAFARMRAAEAAGRKQQGRRRVRQELMRLQLDEKTVDAAVAEVFGPIDEKAQAHAAAAKRQASLARLDAATARRRLAGYLQRRGFDGDVVRDVVNETVKGR
ncbi:MAG: regulatory protein RecX [Phycisphaerae bacterium]